MSNPKMRFRPDIEGLRGIAVLLVVAYHAGVPGFGGGFIGVDIFFVVSGYLITRLLVDELRGTGRLDLLAFYARRARRLLPAAALVILTTLVAGWFILAPLSQMQVSQTALAAATYWSNLHFASLAGDYFGPNLSRNPLLHTWSLAVEEQFYLAWPVLVMLSFWLGRRWRWAFVAVLASVTVTSFAVSVWLTDLAQPWAFFGVHARAWQFGVGGLASMLARAPSRGAYALGAATGWAGLAAVLASGVLFTEAMPWPGQLALLPSLGTALVLVSAVLSPATGAGTVLTVRPLRELGRLSYTWYLWHWPALVLAEAAAGPLTVWERVAVAVGALALSELTHRLVENPVRFHPRLVPSARLSLAAMLWLSLGTVGATLAASATAAPAGEQQKRYMEASRDLAGSARDGCNFSAEAVVPVKCVYGDTSSSTTVVLFGDSHATQWFPALERVALEHGWRLVVHTKSSCTPASVSAVLPSAAPYPECDEWREAVMADLEASHPALIVVATYAATPHMQPAAWAQGLRTTLQRLTNASPAVVYVRDNPAPGFDVPECLSARARWARRACTFDRAAALARNAWEADGLAGLRVGVVNLADAICPAELCPAELGGRVVYRDEHHLTASFSASLAPLFDTALASSLMGSQALHLD